MGLELAAAAKRAMEAGELVEVCARALAETTVRLAGECDRAGAARDEIVAYVNELSASFGETMAMGSAATSQPMAEARAEPSPSPATFSATSPSSRSLKKSKPGARSNRRRGADDQDTARPEQP
jgi:hypothetical protein